MAESKPCTSCGQKPKIVAPEAQELSYYTESSSVMSIRGKMISLQQPLIDSYKSPRGGWRVKFRINGVDYNFRANTAQATFKQARDMFNKNGLKVSNVDLWLNMNLQWYDRIDDKYKLVRHSALLDIAGSSTEPPKVVNPSKRAYTPANWGKHAWNFMGAYLAQDFYEWTGYRGYSALLDTVQLMLNPSENPSIGCNDCYSEFTKELDRLKSNPLNSREEARKWLVDFHNSVNVRLNKPVFNYDSAAKLYLWT